MDDVARYGEACTTPDVDFHIVRSTDIVEKALQKADSEYIHKEKNAVVNNDV